MNYADLSLAKTEIIKKLGYFPAFLIPAIDSSAIYQSLVGQTLFSYINNPLPARFKEKLFVILSRYAGISYFTICHSCTLRSQGMSAAEILALENIEYLQTEAEIAEDLQILSSQWSKNKNWQDNSQIETILLRCSHFIFTRPPAIDLSTLKSLLGINYHYLIILLGYIKLSHQWVIDRPEISHQQDRRSQLHLGSLLLEDIRLAQFFQTKVRSQVSLKDTASPRASWIRMQGKPDRNDRGQLIRMSGIVTEITPQQYESRNSSTEQERLSASNDLRTVINLLPYYLFVVDVPTQTISLINSKLAQSLGLSDPEAVRGGAIAKCFDSKYAERIVRQHQQVIAQDRVLYVQEEVALPDGIHVLNTIITPIYNEQGNVSALLHTSSHIRDLVATQKALSQRTLQLEAANKELESFSYSVSHDLQAPLRVINGFSQVLWDNYQSNLDERGRHYLQRIQANSKRMSDLIDALLQLSRVTRSQMKSMEVNLSAIAIEIMEELQTRDPQRQVELTIAPDLRAKGDPQLLGIVLNNLLDNAWKYTSKRSHSIIEFNVLDRGEQRSTYYLRDNGAGFDPSYADKLFTPFQRLHSQTEFPGTGIGLATVKRIIYRHGGRVWAEGECDRGATIYFSL